MKPKRIITAALLFCSIQLGIAQEIKKDKSKGNWVLESNVMSPRDQIIKFYNSRQELIYQEKVNKKIRIEKKRVRDALDRALNYALAHEKVLESGMLSSSFRNIR